MKKIFFVVFYLLVSFLLAACSISITTKMNANGSGELGFVYKFTQDDLVQLEGMGLNAETICTDIQDQGDTLSDELSFKQETHDDETWCVAAKPFETLEEFKEDISGEGFTVNVIEISGDDFIFDADINISSEITSGVPAAFTIYYEFTAPGKITKHNATKVEGITAIWNLVIGTSTNMHLESSMKPDPTETPASTATSTATSTDIPTQTATYTATPTETPTSTITLMAAPTEFLTSTATSSLIPTQTPSSTTILQDTVREYWWAIAIATLCCCLVVLVFVMFVSLVSRKKKA